MAFIRDYAARDSGDPFRFRVPKKLRKLKVGRALGRVAGLAGGFIPGASTAMQFARAYGMDLGDPGSHKTVSKRRNAGAGTSHKAATKAQHRAQKAVGHPAAATGPAKRRPHPTGRGGLHLPNLDYGALGKAALGAIPVVGGVASELAGQLGAGGGGGGAAITEAPPMGFPGFSMHGMRGHGFGGHRRSMNPANVKALRKSLRRVEGFERLVKRIEKAFPRMRRAHAPQHAPRSARKR